MNHHPSTSLRVLEPTQSQFISYSQAENFQGVDKARTGNSAPQPGQSMESFPEVQVDKAALIEKVCEINKQLYHHATTLPPSPLVRSLEPV